MEIQKLIYFLSLAETLSFTKSAQENHITQACMSRQISALEKHLGVVLFNRNSRNVVLTSAGEEFYSHAQSILNSYNYAVEKISKIEKVQKYIRIGLGPYEHLLAQPIIEKFNKNYPNVRISCVQHDYKTLANIFKSGGIDVMFCINHCAEKISYKEIIELYDGVWITLCSKNSPLVNVKSPKISSFDGQVFINLEAGAEDDKSVAQNLGFRALYSVSTNTLSSKISLTAAGVGISRVPLFVRDYLPNDVFVLNYTYPSIRRFVCVYIKPKTQNDILTSFINIVKEFYP